MHKTCKQYRASVQLNMYSNPFPFLAFSHLISQKDMANSYQVIWERVRANPNKGVPVDIVDAYVPRVIKAVKNCKYYDAVYKTVRDHQGTTGLMYATRAVHPTNNAYVRVTFLLREFSTTSLSDIQYLKKFPPSENLVAALGLESLEPILFGKDTKEHMK